MTNVLTPPRPKTTGSTTAPQPGMVALYRFYDANEALLYVGISNDPRRRWKEHAQAKPWYSQVRHQALTWYETEMDARKAEGYAIAAERPRFNLAGAVRPPHSRVKLRLEFAMVAVAVSCGLVDIPAYVVIYGHPGHVVVALMTVLMIVLFLLMLASGTAFYAICHASKILHIASWLDRNIEPPKWERK